MKPIQQERVSLNYGTCVSTGLTKHNHQYEVRVGLANAEVSAVGKFTALAYQYAAQEWDVGVSYSYAGLSSKTESSTPSAQTTELHWKKRLGRNWTLPPLCNGLKIQPLVRIPCNSFQILWLLKSEFITTFNRFLNRHSTKSNTLLFDNK